MFCISCIAGATIVASCGAPPAGPSTILLTTLPQLQTLAITGLDAEAVVGRAMQAAGLAVLDDGAQRSITSGDWSSSDSTVAAVDANGRVTPVRDGEATITLRTKAASASFTLRVFIDVEGTWEFSYLALDCSQPRASSFGCRRFDGPTPQTGRVAITQTGRAIAAVVVPSFDLLFPGIRTVSGEVGVDRVLRLSGSNCVFGDVSLDNLFTVDDWALAPSADLTFAGRFTWTQRGGCGPDILTPPLTVDVQTWNFRRTQ